MIAPQPPNPAGRLQALRRYQILDTPKETLYDDVVFLAAQICVAPIAVINFIDERRQWFKAEVGLGVRQTPLDTSICSHAILESEFMLVPDTLLDRRFADNPLCAFDPHFRFYAGALLKTPEGHALGTVCVLDTAPRNLTDAQREALLRLSRQVMSLLDLRLALRAAQTSEQLARSAMESNTDLVNVLDLDGRVLSTNKNGSRQMEVDGPSALLHRPWSELWQGLERDKAASALKSAQSGSRAEFEGYCDTAKGTRKYWEVGVSPIMDPEGKPVQILAVSRDVTVRRVEEAQLRETAKLESLGVLAGGLAHDFNNLLTGVLGNACLIENSDNAEDRAYAAEIITAAERAADLTRQMLAYSGKGRFLVERINLSRAVSDILRLIQTTIDKKVELVLSLDETLPSIEGDPTQIQQLVMNLIINASESIQGESGKVVVSTEAIHIDGEAVETPAAGRYILFQVRDTGCGMTAETISKIFDPFFSTKFTGRGLGLAAVSGIVRGHRGVIQVASKVGQGSTFRVYLPIASEHPAMVGSDVRARDSVSHQGCGTILLVDDEEMVRRLGKAGLERFGYDVVLAEDGKMAVEMFERYQREVRLIILDLTMPVMDGEESLKLLRELNPRIPILLSSGYNQVEIIRRFTKQNIAGFLQKPYTMRQLSESVLKALS